MGARDSAGVILDPNNYEGGINHIEIPHERKRHRNEAITEEDHSIFRSELGKLMWIARIGRPGAIYDASAAAQTFSVGKWSICWEKKKTFHKNEEQEYSQKEWKNDFERVPGFS